MGCRIKNIVPNCGYTSNGVSAIFLLDFEDFQGFRFQGDDLYGNCFVEGVARTGEFTEVAASDVSRYNSVLQNGIYTHTVETFAAGLSADFSADLHLSTKRRYVVFFRTKAGKYYCFGYEAGATLNYSNQTEEIGSVVTLSALSVYPLFETDGQFEKLPIGLTRINANWINALCQKGEQATAYIQATWINEVCQSGGIAKTTIQAVWIGPICQKGDRARTTVQAIWVNPVCQSGEIAKTKIQAIWIGPICQKGEQGKTEIQAIWVNELCQVGEPPKTTIQAIWAGPLCQKGQQARTTVQAAWINPLCHKGDSDTKIQALWINPVCHTKTETYEVRLEWINPQCQQV